jgi:hypothetical protein
MKLSDELDPLAMVLPSYVAGGIAVILVYLHGRLWRGGGLGLAAALLVGFNPNLLLRMQEGTPTTLALAGALGALLCYGRHVRSSAESVRRWAWTGPLTWAVAGGLSLGLSLLALGGFGLIVIPVVLLHRLYLRAEAHPGISSRPRGTPWWKGSWQSAGVIDGLLALAVALIVALPWHILMVHVHGWKALTGLESRSWGVGDDAPGLLAHLFVLAPVTLPLGVYAAARAFRLALIDEDNTPENLGGSLWLVWLATATLAPSLWPKGPRAAMDLFLLVPLSLLAAAAVADLVNRRVPVRTLIGLAPATAMSVAWWASEDLRGALDDLVHGRADAATALGLHLALDLILASIWFTRGLDRWARHHDDRQRQLLGCFLLAVLAITVGTGVQEVVFRHSETSDLLSLRTMILRRNRERPFELLAVVGPETATGVPPPGAPPPPRPEETYAGGWLRFILRTALPHLPQRDLGTIDELLTLPDGQRLIILVGSGPRPSYALKSKLGLEAIHPGRTGVLDAYATAHNRPSRR